MTGEEPGCCQSGGRAFGTELGVGEVCEDVTGEDEDAGGDADAEAEGVGEAEAAEVARRRPCPLRFPGRCLEKGAWCGATEAAFPCTPPLRTTSLLLADR